MIVIIPTSLRHQLWVPEPSFVLHFVPKELTTWCPYEKLGVFLFIS